jgi:cytochrome subunit of sulfide dehydrogenase
MRSCILLAAALAALPLPLQAQGNQSGRTLAATCAQCHGTDGRSVSKEVIPLAGLPREHIVSQMKAFKEGKRPGTIMHQLAKGYTDPQIELIADYFANRK